MPEPETMTDPFYDRDDLTALEAQRHAQEIAFAPVVFQVARLMKKTGILAALMNAGEAGLSMDDICRAVSRPRYGVQVLLESSLSSGIVFLKDDRYCISKTGVFLESDRMTGVNMEFIHHVCYRGLFHLEEALDTEKPAGLKELGPWPTIYEGLSQLPPVVQKAWFDFDHLFSDRAFNEALRHVFADRPRRLLDVGGNTGRFAAQCVQRDPDVRVTVMDLPAQLTLMKEAVKNAPGADRISGFGADLLSDATVFPAPFDAIWMSQFLDCFSEAQVTGILRRAVSSMTKDTTLWIMETFWDRQKFETAACCLNQGSVYFTAMANGNSKFYHSKDMVRCAEDAGLIVVDMIDHLGLGHTLMKTRRA